MGKYLMICLTTFLLFTNAANLDAQPKGNKDDVLVSGFFTSLRSIVPDFVARQSYELETGAVFTGYSDVRIPGDTGTLYSLSDDLKADIEPFIRFKLIQPLGERHTISLLYAPLTVISRGRIDRDVNFAGTVFPANTKLKGTYRFDSYRLTYRYDFIKKRKTEFGLGLTAKIRDAGITLEGGGLSDHKLNTGFVPIVNFRLNHKLNNKFGWIFEGDALAAPQGRAEDVALAMTYMPSNQWKLKLGYRMLEGGADNDVVYNFAMFHYVTIGMELGF